MISSVVCGGLGDWEMARTALTRIPGIGKKTAERMVVELRDRAADLAGGALATTTGLPGDPLSEAITALQALGYKPAEAERMARKAATDGDDAAIIIRKALQSALRSGGRARDHRSICPKQPQKPQASTTWVAATGMARSAWPD